MSYPFTVVVQRLHYIYLNRMVTVTRMWTTKRTIPGTVPELLYRCNVAQGSRTVSGTIICERKECTGLRACRVYTTTAFHDDCNTYHLSDRHSSKQSRISFSSAVAEILAAATSADRSIMMSMAFGFLFGGKPFPLALTVDSHGLYSTMTALHEGNDYRLRPTVSRLRDYFEINEITTVQWIPGGKNLANALTKRNFQLFRLLNYVCVSGKLPDHLFANAQCQITRDLTP